RSAVAHIRGGGKRPPPAAFRASGKFTGCQEFFPEKGEQHVENETRHWNGLRVLGSVPASGPGSRTPARSHPPTAANAARTAANRSGSAAKPAGGGAGENWNRRNPPDRCPGPMAPQRQQGRG